MSLFYSNVSNYDVYNMSLKNNLFCNKHIYYFYSIVHLKEQSHKSSNSIKDLTCELKDFKERLSNTNSELCSIDVSVLLYYYCTILVHTFWSTQVFMYILRMRWLPYIVKGNYQLLAIHTSLTDQAYYLELTTK